MLQLILRQGRLDIMFLQTAGSPADVWLSNKKRHWRSPVAWQFPSSPLRTWFPNNGGCTFSCRWFQQMIADAALWGGAKVCCVVLQRDLYLQWAKFCCTSCLWLPFSGHQSWEKTLACSAARLPPGFALHRLVWILFPAAVAKVGIASTIYHIHHISVKIGCWCLDTHVL